jgi:hypothetical protein
MYLIYLCTKFHMPSSSDSFIINVKAKENFRIAMFLFYILQKYYPNESCIFFPSLLPYIISGP